MLSAGSNIWCWHWLVLQMHQMAAAAVLLDGYSSSKFSKAQMTLNSTYVSPVARVALSCGIQLHWPTVSCWPADVYRPSSGINDLPVHWCCYNDLACNFSLPALVTSTGCPVIHQASLVCSFITHVPSKVAP